MKTIIENDIELFGIEQLEKLGYKYIYSPDIAPDASTSSTSKPERATFEDVLLIERLQKAVARKLKRY